MTTKTTKAQLATALAALEPSVHLGMQEASYWYNRNMESTRPNLLATAERMLDFYTAGKGGLSPAFTDGAAEELLNLVAGA